MSDGHDREKIIEAAKAGVDALLEMGKQAGVCPNCYIIAATAIAAKVMSDERFGEGSATPLDRFVFAVMSDFYDLEIEFDGAHPSPLTEEIH